MCNPSGYTDIPIENPLRRLGSISEIARRRSYIDWKRTQNDYADYTPDLISIEAYRNKDGRTTENVTTENVSQRQSDYLTQNDYGEFSTIICNPFDYTNNYRLQANRIRKQEGKIRATTRSRYEDKKARSERRQEAARYQ